MKKSLFQAVAKSGNVIEVAISKEYYGANSQKYFSLYQDGKAVLVISPVSISESNSSYIFTLLYQNFTFKPGYKYEIKLFNNFFVPVDISFLAKTEEFEKKYRYDGKLGAIYSKEKTTFRVFSPFSTSIILKLKRKDHDKIEAFVMDHNLDVGIFEITIDGDLDEAKYLYSATIFDETYDVPDPYSYALGSNSRYSYVIDPQKIYAVDTHDDCLPPFDDVLKAIIYECDVRDMTSKTNLPDKGTYNALAKEGYLTKNNNPMGLDYLGSLGVTHIQLQPVLDFQTIDDDNPRQSYNWGYDPSFFFAPEGSYASYPDSAYSRIIELRNLVGMLHKKGLRVTLDVVYNHVFDTSYNSFNILVPNYYVRLNHDGSFSNGSGCGNDLETRNYMCRKMIIDSLLHCIDFFDVDGFRFDLMGILDVETVNRGYQACIEKKNNIMFYGEGWDLPTNLPADLKANHYNYNKLPNVAFFNDRFRDIVKGKTTTLAVKGYLSGDPNYLDGFKHVMLGSSVALAFAPMFTSIKQSLNYVECHDNHVLFDKLKCCCYDESVEDILKRIKMINFSTLIACGIPFFHAGQEIGLSKKGNGNSYNSGDDINGFDYSVLDEREDMYVFFKDAITLKKRFIEMEGVDPTNVNISFDNLPCGAIKINYDLKNCYVYIILNPSKNTFTYEFKDYASLIFNDTGIVTSHEVYIHLAIINALSINVFLVSKEEKESEDD